MTKKHKERTQKELYKILKAAGLFITDHSRDRTQKFNDFYSELKKNKVPIRYVKQGNDFDLLIWHKEGWKSFNEMVKAVFE